MKIATAYYHSNIPEGAIIYGKFTQPFGVGVDRESAAERLAVIIENNGPTGEEIFKVSDRLAWALTAELDWPRVAVGEITFYLYAMED